MDRQAGTLFVLEQYHLTQDGISKPKFQMCRLLDGFTF